MCVWAGVWGCMFASDLRLRLVPDALRWGRTGGSFVKHTHGAACIQQCLRGWVKEDRSVPGVKAEPRLARRMWCYAESRQLYVSADVCSSQMVEFVALTRWVWKCAARVWAAKPSVCLAHKRFLSAGLFIRFTRTNNINNSAQKSLCLCPAEEGGNGGRVMLDLFSGR